MQCFIYKAKDLVYFSYCGFYKMQEYVIIVPIYKEILDDLEIVSLKRLNDLNIPSITFIAPEGLSLSYYFSVYKQPFKVSYFDKKYFKNEVTYSDLCLSYEFYNRFSDYTYMLIYQLDCYLFRNEIHEWCQKNYDYIGAPIFAESARWNVYKNKVYCPAVGNGGLSLRKIEVFKELTNPGGDFLKYTTFQEDIFKQHIDFEDLYFCDWITPYYELNKPNWKEASMFSLDMNVNIAYNNLHILDKDKTPMGCHAFGKNIWWWKDYIPEITSEMIKKCNEKYPEYAKYYEDTKLEI